MIRRATLADLPDITRVRTAVHENHLSVDQMAARGITQQSVGAALQSGSLAAWVTEVDGRIAGFAMAALAEEKLFALFTDPQHQGRGIGSALLAIAEDWLRMGGAGRICLDTGDGTRAVDFYLRRGYRIVHRSDGDVFLEKAMVPA